MQGHLTSADVSEAVNTFEYLAQTILFILDISTYKAFDEECLSFN